LKPLIAHPVDSKGCCFGSRNTTCIEGTKGGKDTFPADTLNRAHLPEVHVCELSQELETVNPVHLLAMPAKQLETDSSSFLLVIPCCKYRETILRGWPNSKTEVPETVHVYDDIDIRDEL
jgi:hypothetical protein